MEPIFIIILVLTFIGVSYCIVGLLKNDNTYRNHMKLLDAIHAYAVDMIDRHRWDLIEVSYEDMEPYDATFSRWWDWGYTRILHIK